LKALAESIREVDRKREADRELILSEIKKASKAVAAPPAPTAQPSAPAASGFKYTVQSGDTLSAIVAAYRREKVNVTVEDVLKANPGLKANSMKVGQAIVIPDGAR